MQQRCCLTFSNRDRRFCTKPINGYRLAEPVREVHIDGLGVVTMSITLEKVVEKYLAAAALTLF